MQMAGQPILLLKVLAVLSLLTPTAALAQEVGSSLYIRDDTDHTLVISPRLRIAGEVDSSTRIDASYTVDVWSSASIDIRSSATINPSGSTKRIYEQRDEVDLAVSHIIDSSTLSGSYRYSKENDYESHGGTLSLAQDFADKSTNLVLALSGIFDDVGRSGDTSFSKPLNTFGARVALTQILDTQTLIQLSYDLFIINGFQESAYRKVRLLDGTPGCAPMLGPDGMIANLGVLDDPKAFNGCRIYENVPDDRMRHAFALQGRRAFGPEWSAGLGYRLYTDDWGLLSHTVEARLSFLPADHTTLALRYRFYTQGKASFYKPYYTSDDTYRTNDRELSSLMSHRVGLDLEQEFEFGPATVLAAIVAGINHYDYSEFPGLTTVQAFELTTSLSAEF